MSGYLVGLNINDVAAETFSGNASTTAFTLAVAGTTNTCGVYILGVHQVPTTDYSVSGTTLTFTAAPPTGTNNICVVYTKPQTVGAPSDATVTTAKLSGNLVTPGTLDLNGQELILDANANTSITADTDDQIDIKIGGADDFQFTANTFTALSGSTIDGGAEIKANKISPSSSTAFQLGDSGDTFTIPSGATIVNSGTSTGFGADAERAVTGVLETNANFVDQVIFGPSVDGRAWKGLWNKASLFSSLMVATVEDAGSDTQVNIWDLTEQSSGTISTTALGTVNLSADATPTSIDACMGYIIVGSEDGISIIDPHSGAWAERVDGYPKTLSTSTIPALSSNAVGGVAAGLANQPALDPHTGGPMPTFAVTYTSGSNYGSVIKTDGNVWDDAGSAGTGVNDCAIDNGLIYQVEYNGGTLEILWKSKPIEEITSDATFTKDGVLRNDAGAWNFGWELDKRVSIRNYKLATANTSGLTIGHVDSARTASYGTHINALINRTYNTGMLAADARGVFLANSKTVDRGPYANTLTETGTVPTEAVASGAELTAYGPFSTSNYLGRANDSDFSFGTADYYMSFWYKQSAATGAQVMVEIGNTGQTAYTQLWSNAGVPRASINDGSTNAPFDVGFTPTVGEWHQYVYLNDQTNNGQRIYIDGVSYNPQTGVGLGSMTIASSVLRIGISGNSSSYPATTIKIALVRIATTAPTDTQIRQMYEAEKPMFAANAECLLQSGSTDVVLDVDVDPLSNKVLVTQTDAITVFDGLVVDSKPTVNSGSSEKGKLWGALRTEQNSANAYVTAPAVDQRQVNEMVRGLASDVPKGVDLSKAKGWLHLDHSNGAILGSYNVKSVEDVSAGNFKITWAIPFRSEGSSCYQITALNRNSVFMGGGPWSIEHKIAPFTTYSPGTTTGSDSDNVFVVAFGELENE